MPLFTPVSIIVTLIVVIVALIFVATWFRKEIRQAVREFLAGSGTVNNYLERPITPHMGRTGGGYTPAPRFANPAVDDEDILALANKYADQGDAILQSDLDEEGQ